MRPIVPILIGIVLAGCASPAPRQSASPAPVQTPPDPAPVALHALELESPPGEGRVTLTRVVRFRSETDPLIVRLRTQRGEPAYTRTEEHVAAGTITLTDDLGRWAFRYTRLDLSGAPTGINVVFLNQSPGSVHVDWNRTVFVDPTRRSRRLIHRGVKLTDREAATPASVVPAGAGLDDFVFPTDAIFFVSGRYGGWSASPVFERLRPGDSFTLVVGLQAGGQATERNFRFRVVPG